jgi:hypothetical protein
LPSGTKAWRYQYHLNGKREKVTIGSYPVFTIKQARDRHEELRALVDRGDEAAVCSMTRKRELLRSKWPEFDLDAAQWDIPAERMKMGKAHRVFLSRQAVELLRQVHELTGHSEYVLPSISRGSMPMGDVTLNHFFKRIDFGVPDFSPHGLWGTAATLLLERPSVAARGLRALSVLARNAVRLAPFGLRYRRPAWGFDTSARTGFCATRTVLELDLEPQRDPRAERLLQTLLQRVEARPLRVAKQAL